MADRVAPISAVSYPTDSFRELIQAIFPSQGILNPGDMVVTQQGSPTMGVTVAAGFVIAQGVLSTITQGSYPFLKDAAANYAIAAADPTNPRHDIVCAVITDSVYAVDGTPNTQNIRVITGTPNAGAVSSSAPYGATGDPAIPATWAAYVILARVQVNAGAGSILNANITDLRSRMTPYDPAGVMKQYAGSVAPSGWLICDGTAYSRTTYANLFAVCGTTYGAGDGSTTFNVPDMRGRIAVGVGSVNSNAQPTVALGGTTSATTGGAGEALHTLAVGEVPSHTHGMSNHTHNQRTIIGTNSGGNVAAFGSNGQIDNFGGGSNNTTAAPNQPNTDGGTGGGGSHNNMQPFMGLNYIIKV